MQNTLRLPILILVSILLCSCESTPSRPFTEEERKVLFIKDYIPSSTQCRYFGRVKYGREPYDSGCAVYSRQARAFIKKAASMGANLVVAGFSKDNPGYHVAEDGKASCNNDAKMFACDEKTLSELRRFE